VRQLVFSFPLTFLGVLQFVRALWCQPF